MRGHRSAQASGRRCNYAAVAAAGDTATMVGVRTLLAVENSDTAAFGFADDMMAKVRAARARKVAAFFAGKREMSLMMTRNAVAGCVARLIFLRKRCTARQLLYAFAKVRLDVPEKC